MGEEEKRRADEKEEERQRKEVDGKTHAAGEKKSEGGVEAEKKEHDGVSKEGDGNGKKPEGGDDGGEGEGVEKKETPPPPPPPEEIVLRVHMHCEGCARKVQRSLAGFRGVEGVTADCRTHRVVVRGKAAAADPLRVVDRVQRKSGRRVELLTPIPPEPEKEVKKKKEEEEEKPPKPEEKKKEEQPPVMAALLKVRMHCDACAQEMRKRILRVKGLSVHAPPVHPLLCFPILFLKRSSIEIGTKDVIS